MMPLQTLSEKDNTIACVFCKSPAVDEINFGPIYARDGTACHYYCMLFSAALKQTGRDEEGILGFHALEIHKEVRRAARLRCAYCHVMGASVGCCKKKCAKAFHFTCGVLNGANFQFFGQYEAFCSGHAPVQGILLKYKDWSCPICMSRVTHHDGPLMANCCQGAVFHTHCLKRMALNAGYFFKCPMCNATKTFIDEMRKYGVFVPEQDASWEREPNAFEDLLFEYMKCDAEICECSKGREYNAAKGGFILARCRSCGAAGVHRQCGKLKTVANWACAACLDVEIKTEEIRLKTEKNKPKITKTEIRKPSASVVVKVSNNVHQRIANLSALTNCRTTKQDSPQLKRCVVDLSKVKISSSCFNYFPYLQDHMDKFESSTLHIVPDWRGLTIRPNVVNWLGKYVRKSFKAPKKSSVRTKPPYQRKTSSSPQELRVNETNKATCSKNVSSTLKIAAAGFDSTCTNPKNVKKPRKFRKASKWSRGSVSKKKSANKKPKTDTHMKVQDDSSTMISKQLANRVETNENKYEELSAGTEPEAIEETLPCKKKTPPKRKVVELGYRLFASGINKELFVQSNVEVGEKVFILEEEEIQIDWNGLRPLGTFNENVSTEDKISESQYLMQIEECQEEDILRLDSAVRDVSMEHSYCSNTEELSQIVGKGDTASCREAGKFEEDACDTFRNRSKDSVESRNGKNIL